MYDLSEEFETHHVPQGDVSVQVEPDVLFDEFGVTPGPQTERVQKNQNRPSDSQILKAISLYRNLEHYIQESEAFSSIAASQYQIVKQMDQISNPSETRRLLGRLMPRVFGSPAERKALDQMDAINKRQQELISQRDTLEQFLEENDVHPQYYQGDYHA